MKNKIIFLFNFIILFSTLLLFLFLPNVNAATPKLITKINDAFEAIEGWVLNLATPAAAVAVASGVFMKKFSFGDEEKIRTGKKIIRGSLFSYGFLLAIDLILSLIKSLIT